MSGSNNSNENEDKRSAVKLGTSLSSQLISATFAIMGIVGGFIVYILENNSTIWTYLTFAVGVLSYVISIYNGGIGITVARNNGFKGDWKIDVTKNYFDRQAIFLVIGTILLVVTIFLTQKNPTAFSKELKVTNQILKSRVDKIDSLLEQSLVNEKRIGKLERKIDSLTSSSKKAKTQ